MSKEVVEKPIKIYSSTSYIKNPEVGDFRLKVNSRWDFGSRSVCFGEIKTPGGDTATISYDLQECVNVEDGIIIGGTRKVKNTKWEKAKLTPEIAHKLEEDGYILSNNHD